MIGLLNWADPLMLLKDCMYIRFIMHTYMIVAAGIHEGIEQAGAYGEDLVLVSDTDEIPRRSTVRAMSWCEVSLLRISERWPQSHLNVFV